MFYITNDPISDADRWDREGQRLLERSPRCDCCGEYIQDDHYYEINDENICPDCLENEFRKEL